MYDGVVFMDVILNVLSDFDENVVIDGMIVDVVDCFEMVEIEIKECNGMFYGDMWLL